VDYTKLNIVTLIQSDRETASHYHFAVGRMWRLIGIQNNLHVPLSYAAFEFRLSIERYLFEYFYLIRHRRGFSKSEERECSSIARLIKAIYQHEGGKARFLKRLRFNLICIQSEAKFVNNERDFPNGLPIEISLDYLHKLWIKLSEFCHRQLEPNETWKSKGERWVKNGYDILIEAEEHLTLLFRTNSHCWLSIDGMKEQYKTLNDEFCASSITEEEMKSRLLALSKKYNTK